MTEHENEGMDRYLQAESSLEDSLSQLRVSEIKLHALCEPLFSKYLSKYDSASAKRAALDAIFSSANDIMVLSNNARIEVSRMASIMLEGQK